MYLPQICKTHFPPRGIFGPNKLKKMFFEYWGFPSGQNHFAGGPIFLKMNFPKGGKILPKMKNSPKLFFGLGFSPQKIPYSPLFIFSINEIITNRCFFGKKSSPKKRFLGYFFKTKNPKKNF